MYKKRRINMPLLPATLNDVAIEGPYTSTIDGDNFLQRSTGNNNDRIVIFCSRVCLKYLCQANAIFCDGTFHFAPRPFCQLYTIHALVMNEVMLPLVFCLLPNKSLETYSRVITEIRLIAIGENLNFMPHQVVIDFEISARNAWELAFPNIEVRGCLFHFGQCIWRRIQALGLAGDYNNSPEFTAWARLIFALPLLPLGRVEDFWHDNIMASAPFQVIYFIFLCIYSVQ